MRQAHTGDLEAVQRNAGGRFRLSWRSISGDGDLRLLEDVLSAISLRYRDIFPGLEEPPRILSASLQRRRFSDTARLRLKLDRKDGEFYIKFHKNPRNPENWAESEAHAEYETLRWLSEGFASVAGCSVPRPIAYVSKPGAVVTEKVFGTDLRTLLNRPLRMFLEMNGSRAEEWCQQIGRWLRKFQELTTRPEKEIFSPGRFRTDIEELIERCETLGLSHLFVDEVGSWLRSGLTRIGEPELEVVGQHGDFYPRNILVGPGGITVLDFTSFKYGNRYHDVACFLTMLDSRIKHPFFRKTQMENLQTSFLQGYRLLSLEDPILPLYRVKEMLNYCVTFLSRRPASLLPQSVIRRGFLRWAEQQAIPGLLT